MGELIRRKVRGMNWKTKISLVLVFATLFFTFLYQGMYQPVETTAGLLHNSAELNSTLWAGGWGTGNGKYGAFTCATCHDRVTTNIKRIKTVIRTPDGTAWPRGWNTTSWVSFSQADGTNSNMGDTASPMTGICNVCHETSRHQHYSWNTYARDGIAHNAGVDCTKCHAHNKGFAGAGACNDCHDQVQGGIRDAVVTDFVNGKSHHVQFSFTTIRGTDCYQCHWEADNTGGMSGYHAGPVANGAVDLVVWGNVASRPGWYTLTGPNVSAVAYTANPQTRAELAKITTACLGCHNDTNKNSTPFGDSKRTNQYAWDSTSVASRYAQAGTTTWGKYTWATMGARKNIAKAYSAHGNATNNVWGWDSLFGYDANIPNQSGNVDVECFDCHNSHGSNIAGRSTSYATFGGILKDTTNGIGGYTATYKPAGGGSSATKNTYEPGAGLCFDCHMTRTSSVASPWGYNDTFGAIAPIMGFIEKPYWWGPNWSTVGQRAGMQKVYFYKNARAAQGSHFVASSSISSTPQDRIEGVCTNCHDPHGVSASLGADQQYGVPLLKGTFLTSPYRQDAAPDKINLGKGGGSRVTAGSTVSSYPGYHIDQNTFRPPIWWWTGNQTVTLGNPNWPWGSGAKNMRSFNFVPWSSFAYDMTMPWATVGRWQIGEVDTQFGGLCLKCHPKTQIQPATTGGWMTYSRVHNTVKGWANTTGNNANNVMHSYVCSKCHNPHSTQLPRLMVTNCLDMRHRGQVSGGGTRPPQVSTSTTSGGGRGRFPGGGGGYGCPNSSGLPTLGKFVTTAGANTNGGFYYFGANPSSSTAFVPFTQCHEGNYAAMGAPWGSVGSQNYWVTTYQGQKWNTKTQWNSL